MITKKLNMKTCPGLMGRKNVPMIKVNKSGLVFNIPASNLLALDPVNEVGRIAFDLAADGVYMYWDNTNGFPIFLGSTKRYSIHHKYLSVEIMKHVGKVNPRLLIGEFKEGKYPLTTF